MVYLFIGALLIIAAKSQNCTTMYDCMDAYTPICADYGECVECTTNEHCLNNTVYANAGEDICQDNVCASTTTTTTFAPVICTTMEDCQDAKPVSLLGYGCETITIQSQSISICLPLGNCEQTADCLAGSECLVTNIPDIQFSVGFCMPSNSTCTQDSDCDDSLECYETDGVCILPCDSNEDCDVDGWACSYIEDTWACSPSGFGNFTTMTDMPTTTGNQSGATQFAIFGGIIIMIKYVLFM